MIKKLFNRQMKKKFLSFQIVAKKMHSFARDVSETKKILCSKKVQSRENCQFIYCNDCSFVYYLLRAYNAAGLQKKIIKQFCNFEVRYDDK